MLRRLISYGGGEGGLAWKKHAWNQRNHYRNLSIINQLKHWQNSSGKGVSPRSELDLHTGQYWPPNPLKCPIINIGFWS